MTFIEIMVRYKRRLDYIEQQQRQVLEAKEIHEDLRARMRNFKFQIFEPLKILAWAQFLDIKLLGEMKSLKKPFSPSSRPI